MCPVVQEEASLWRKASKPGSTALLHHPVTGASRGEVLVGASPGMEGPGSRSSSSEHFLSSHVRRDLPDAQQDVAEGWLAGSPHTRHPRVLPQACQRRASELTSPPQTFCPITSLPSLVRFKTRFWKYASGFLHLVLLTFTVLSTWKTLLVPFVEIMLRPKFHLYFSLFSPQTFHTQWLKYWLLAERYLTPPTIPLAPSFVTFEKAIIFYLIYVYICMHFMVPVWSQRTIWGDKFLLGKWALGTELKWSGLEPCPFMHTVISVTFHPHSMLRFLGMPSQHQMFWRARQYPLGIFCSPAS